MGSGNRDFENSWEAEFLLADVGGKPEFVEPMRPKLKKLTQPIRLKDKIKKLWSFSHTTIFYATSSLNSEIFSFSFFIILF